MEFVNALALTLVNLWMGQGISLTAFVTMVGMFLRNQRLHQIALANAAMRKIEARDRRIFKRAVQNIGYFYKGREFLEERKGFTELFRITGYDPKRTKQRVWKIEQYCKAKYPMEFAKETKDTLKKTLRASTAWEINETWKTAYELWARPTVQNAVDLAEFKFNWICTVDTTAMKNQDEVTFVFKGSSWLIDCIYNHKEKTAGILMVGGKTRYYFFNVPITALMLVVEKNGKQMWDGFGWLFSTNPYHWVRRRGLKKDGTIRRRYDRMITKKALNYWKFSKNAKKGSN